MIDYEKAFERFQKSRPGFWRHLTPREKFNQVAYEQRFRRDRKREREARQESFLTGERRREVKERMVNRSIAGSKSDRPHQKDTMARRNSEGWYSIRQIAKMEGISESTISYKIRDKILIPIEDNHMKFLRIEDVKNAMVRFRVKQGSDEKIVEIPLLKDIDPRKKWIAVEEMARGGWLTLNGFSKQFHTSRPTLRRLIEAGRISFKIEAETIFVNRDEVLATVRK